VHPVGRFGVRLGRVHLVQLFVVALLEVDDGPFARPADLDHREAVHGGVGERHHAVQESGRRNSETDARLLRQKAGDRRGVASGLLVPESDEADALRLSQPREVGDRDAGNTEDGVQAVQLQGVDHQVEPVGDAFGGRFGCHGHPAFRDDCCGAASIPVDPTAFFLCSSATCWAVYPSSRSTSSVCSPRSGALLISGVKVENFIGQPTVQYEPRTLCGTSTTVPFFCRNSSCLSSFMDSTGEHGTSNLLKCSTASYLVLSARNFSISAKMSKMWGCRALAVLNFGSFAHSGCPTASAVRFQFESW